MELWCKLSWLLVVAAPIAANPFVVNYRMLSNSNPLELDDLLELQDTSVLDQLGQSTKNLDNFISKQLPDTLIYKKLSKPLCPDSVLEFSGRDDVKFMLYNKNHPFGVDISTDLPNGMLIANAPIKFVIHGFLNGGNSLMVQTVKDAYMSRTENYNVIIVDWSKGSGTWLSNYYICLITSRVVPMVGHAVADFVIDLMNQQDVNVLYVNLIGHSLGAQIAGLAGKRLNSMGYKLPIIVGLDPALPEFKNVDESERLCPSDAEYVEVIHTNCGELGFEKPIGTADYYPNFKNYRYRMPGCNTSSCSHAMSFKYFAESVKSPFAFEARGCDSFSALKDGRCNGGTTYMGGNDMRVGKAAGIFVLETNRDEPYGRSIQ